MSICNRTQQECRDPKFCLQAGCVGLQLSQPPQQPDKLREGANAIRARIKQKREEYASFQQYLAMRVREEDLHGIWDCGAQMSEVTCVIDGLLYALEALGEEP